MSKQDGLPLGTELLCRVDMALKRLGGLSFENYGRLSQGAIAGD
jgi:hypothetical protein